MPDWQNLRFILENTVFHKLKLSQNINKKINLLSLLYIFISTMIQIILDIEN